MSVTMTYGPPLDFINKPLSLSRTQVKLFCHSLDKYANAIEKVNSIDITPTISSNVNRSLLVL